MSAKVSTLEMADNMRALGLNALAINAETRSEAQRDSKDMTVPEDSACRKEQKHALSVSSVGGLGGNGGWKLRKNLLYAESDSEVPELEKMSSGFIAVEVYWEK
ncbi:hypothetical protein B0H11DRAFT_1918891 [Mycena galericulata]|nr:hypothetical protein B0H11DRAFT_1918891 [Mycena galericulata]